jgi:hypothetical protein
VKEKRGVKTSTSVDVVDISEKGEGNGEVKKSDANKSRLWTLLK